MKIAELRKLNSGELADKLKTLKQDLFQLRFQRATGQLENGNQIRFLRRDIARVETLLHTERLTVHNPVVVGRIQAREKEMPRHRAGIKRAVVLSLRELRTEARTLRLQIRTQVDPTLKQELHALLTQVALKLKSPENRKEKGKKRLPISPAAYRVYLRFKKIYLSGRLDLRARDLKALQGAGQGFEGIARLSELKKKKVELLTKIEDLRKTYLRTRDHGISLVKAAGKGNNQGKTE